MSLPLVLGSHGPPVGDTGAIESFASQVYPAILESLGHFGPEVKVAVAAMVILLLDLLIPLKYSKHLAWAAIAACLLPLGDIAHHYEEQGSLFLGMTAMDSFASFFKGFFLIGSIPVILLSYISKQLEGRRMGEYYFILLASVFGGMLMASSTHFLMLFLSLEILSVCSYILVGYVRSDRRGAEAALKYIIYGSIAAAIMAYGFSLWFGLTGSGEIRNLARVLWDPAFQDLDSDALILRTGVAVAFALLFIFAGLAYKMSTIPMHFWAPDVYDGAPTPITAFLSVISKAAGFAIALRFFGSLAESIASLETGNAAIELWNAVDWRLILIVISIITMTLGNFAALWQTNLKRLMAYSSIAHAGYLMMGLTLLGTAAQYGGMETITFYLLAYLAMNFGAFAVVILIENRLGSVDVADYAGIGRRAPYLAFALTVFLFSLIGVPPTAGFMGKLHLLMGVVDLGRILESQGDPQAWAYYLLALAAIANTAVSAYYYLKVAKAMYFERAASVEELRSPLVGHAVVTAMLVLTFYLCFYAGDILKTTLNLDMSV
jgi:NADH-quinone oxidoreductase subunit N